MHYAVIAMRFLMSLCLGMNLLDSEVASADTYEAGILDRSYISDIQRQIIGRSAYRHVKRRNQ